MATPYEERDEQLRVLIRREIDKREGNRAELGFPSNSPEDRMIGAEIYGMRKILALVDPEPWR